MSMNPENTRDGSLRDLLVALAREGMEEHGLLTVDLADRVGVSVKYLRNVLDKQTSGSVELWDKILTAVRSED